LERHAQAKNKHRRNYNIVFVQYIHEIHQHNIAGSASGRARPNGTQIEKYPPKQKTTTHERSTDLDLEQAQLSTSTRRPPR
jgi:hypothetical protein